MFVTDQFVVLHLPKTGSTFIRETLKGLYRNESNPFYELLYKLRLKKRHYKELFFEKVEINELYAPMYRNRFSPHGIYYQIPAKHKAKQIVSVVRNPFERLVSAYKFGSWATKHPPSVMEDIKSHWPHFPSLSFQEFLDFSEQFGDNHLIWNNKIVDDLGSQTKQFFWFFMKAPFDVIPNIDNKFIEQRKYRETLAGIHFLRTDQINFDLYQLLKEQGIPEKKIQFVLKASKVNQTKKVSSIKEYFTDGQIERILHKERVLFDLFPEFRL